MGFSEEQAQTAASQYDTVQQALDSLLAGRRTYHFLSYSYLFVCVMCRPLQTHLWGAMWWTGLKKCRVPCGSAVMNLWNAWNWLHISCSASFGGCSLNTVDIIILATCVECQSRMRNLLLLLLTASTLRQLSTAHCICSYHTCHCSACTSYCSSKHVLIGWLLLQTVCSLHCRYSVSSTGGLSEWVVS